MPKRGDRLSCCRFRCWLNHWRCGYRYLGNGRGNFSGGFLSKLLFDLTHLGKAQQAACASWVNRVFRWHDHRDQQRDGHQQSDYSRAQELKTARQLIKGWSFAIEHMKIPY